VGVGFPKDYFDDKPASTCRVACLQHGGSRLLLEQNLELTTYVNTRILMALYQDEGPKPGSGSWFALSLMGDPRYDVDKNRALFHRMPSAAPYYTNASLPKWNNENRDNMADSLVAW
jgi:hypothetical protein